MRSALVGLLLTIPAAAHADGAFPDELQVFAPPTLPQELVVGTNYGLLTSHDDGQTWSWLCEPAVSSQQVNAYGVGADGQLFGLAGALLARSSDDGCSWSTTTLAQNVRDVSDLFADPTDPARALAIGYDGAQFGLYATADGGGSWSGPALTGTTGLFGVEIARSDDTRAYVSAYQASGSAHAVLFRSDDRGQTWSELDHPELGNVFMYIAAVDPSDKATVWFRLTPGDSSTGDRIAVTHDSGATISVVLQAPGVLSALAVGEDHSVWTADRANDLWRLDPDAGAFEQLRGPSVRCLAERDGVLYACGDTQSDGFVLGASTDRGTSFKPLVTTTGYQTLACAVSSGACPAVNVPADAGMPDAGPSSPPPASGCGCASTPAPGAALAFLLGLALIARRGRASTRAGRARRSCRW